MFAVYYNGLMSWNSYMYIVRIINTIVVFYVWAVLTPALILSNLKALLMLKTVKIATTRERGITKQGTKMVL